MHGRSLISLDSQNFETEPILMESLRETETFVHKGSAGSQKLKRCDGTSFSMSKEFHFYLFGLQDTM